MSNPVDVQWYTSAMTGAPSYTGIAGNMNSLLKGCLIDGFNSNTLTSLSVSSHVATAVVSAGHNFTNHVVVLVDGATTEGLTGLNGLKRITVTNSTTFTFDATGIEDGTETATVTAKVAPCNGWDMPFYDNGTYKNVFRQTDLDTGQYYHLIEHGTKSYARLISYSSMSDINTGSNAFNLASGGTYLTSFNDDGTTNNWLVVASRFGVFVGTNRIYASYNGTFYFGDIIPFSGSAVRRTVHSGLIDTGTTGSRGLGVFSTAGNSISGTVSGTFANTGLYKRVIGSAGTYSGNCSVLETSTLYGTQKFVGRVIAEDTAGEFRGMWPGLLVPYTALASPSLLTVEDFVVGGVTRKAILYRSRISSSATSWGLIDITGPWNDY